MVGLTPAAPAAGIIRVASDTKGSIASTTVETEIATVTVPANLIKNGIIVYAAIGVTGSTSDAYFRLKIGADGSEATKQTVRLSARVGATLLNGGSLLFDDSTQTWTNEISVIVTAENNQPGAGDIATCFQLVVEGY
ncbi:hypothetical protein LCGC14_3142050 [marine sediment metagenome]|uniref:Uncharacterized protein n=1 Tax=marine sediment metagenome TaxID=412755 RepID=A0A0F8VWP2_9ZZZZ